MPSWIKPRMALRSSGQSVCWWTETACWTATSSNSSSLSAEMATLQLVSLGNSRQSMYLRLMTVLLAKGYYHYRRFDRRVQSQQYCRMTLSPWLLLLLALPLLKLGEFTLHRIPLLARFNLPVPVVGGLLCAVAALLLRA